MGRLPIGGAVIIVTASYEGQPPDNARQFISWMDGLPAGALNGVKYAVFGCGNKDWARTYQAIPRKVDQRLADAGAERLLERGEANARGDFFGDFDRWYTGIWAKIGAALGQQARAIAPMPLLEIEFVQGVRDPLLRQNNLQMGTIVDNRELVNMAVPHARSKRHIEIALPETARYRTGDYLAILPLNPPDNVDRVLRRFGFSYDTQLVIHMSASGQTFFPTRENITAGELVRSYVELGQAATRQQVEQLAISTACPLEKKALEALIADDKTYSESILEKNVTVLDLLERFTSCCLPFAQFLQLLPPLKPRQYSISSSPLWNAQHCTLTVAVVRAPALSGQGIYQGVASTYLANARPGTKVAVMTRPSNIAFHPPDDLATPIVMVCAGTGIAPFHGFIQDRAMRAREAAQIRPAPALLFFGCGHPDVDFLYKDELLQWEQQGLVSVRPAFSLTPEARVKYVQDRLWRDRAEVAELVRQGATLFVCGDGRYMAPAVHDTCTRIYQEATDSTPDEAEQWMTRMEREHGRYVADVFA